MDANPSSNPLTVNEMAVKVYKVALDAATGQIWLHTEAAVGMSDGSTRPGVVVTHFFNGKQGPEATTDDFGVATLQTHIPPDLVRVGEQNTLTIRVRGSIKSASEPFGLLTESVAITNSDDEFLREQEYSSFKEERRERKVSVEVRLSKKDFKEVGGVKVRALLGGSSFGEGTTDTEGTCTLSRSDRYTVKTRFRDSGDQVIDPSERFPSLSTMVVNLVGFPDEYRIRVK